MVSPDKSGWLAYQSHKSLNLILWGVISIVGFSLTPYLKEWSGLFWSVAGIAGGILSAFIGKKEDAATGKYTAHIGRQIGFVFLSMFICGWALTLVLIANLSSMLSNSALGLIIGIGWIALISMAWFITGIISNNSSYMIIPAILLIISATVSAIFTSQYFYYVIAVFGGGGMLISGLLARNKNK